MTKRGRRTRGHAPSSPHDRVVLRHYVICHTAGYASLSRQTVWAEGRIEAELIGKYDSPTKANEQLQRLLNAA